MVAGLTGANMKPEHLAVTEEGIGAFRAQSDAQTAAIIAGDQPFFDTKIPLCDITDFDLKTRDGTVIKVFVIRPKSLSTEEKHPAYIWAHGGGGIKEEAKTFNSLMCNTAVNLNCVVFSVDYRLGPEVKCPVGQEDFLDGVEHVIANADTFGVDSGKLCLAGISGGGWIVAGVANMLAKADRSNIVKACFIHTGMLSDETAKVPAEELEVFEYWMAPHMTSCYKLHAKDYDA